jgi:hypothetical protein
LATLKAKRGQETEVGFGTKIKKSSTDDKTEKPENYLGPGLYEQKGSFDMYSKTTANPQSKSCQNFLSAAPRFVQGQNQSKLSQFTPGPGAYTNDGGGFNPWFKRSYNMLFAEH